MTTHPSRYVFGKIRPVSDPVRNRTQQPGLTGERKESIPIFKPHRRHMVDVPQERQQMQGGWARGQFSAHAHTLAARCW